MKRIINWLKKPLPKGLCQAMGKGDNCVAAWFNIGVMASVITVLLVLSNFTTVMDVKPRITECSPAVITPK